MSLLDLMHKMKHIEQVGGGDDEDLLKSIEDIKEICDLDDFTGVLPAARRIIVIGDIHGDYNAAIKCLQVSKVIDDKLNWIGKDTHIVQVGDQVDRCRPGKYKCDHPKATKNDEGSDLEILKLFTQLHHKAKPHGGGVYSLLGNHEIMNILGDFGYVSHKGLEQFEDYVDPNDPDLTFRSGKHARTHAFKPGNEWGKYLGCHRHAILIIGSCLFVHGGLMNDTMKYLNIQNSSDIDSKINIPIKKWLLKLSNKTSIDKLIDYDKKSIFWNRVFGNIKTQTEHDICDTQLYPMFETLKVGKIFIGHTPQFYDKSDPKGPGNGINSTCNKSVWRVDAGISGAFNMFDRTLSSDGVVSEQRKIQVLEVLNDKKFNILS